MGVRLSCALHTVVELHPSVGSALVFYHITSALLHFFFFFLTNASVLKVLKKTQTSVSFLEFETYIAFLQCAKNKKRIFSLCAFLPFKSHFYNLMSKFQGCNMILLYLKEKKYC